MDRPCRLRYEKACRRETFSNKPERMGTGRLIISYQVRDDGLESCPANPFPVAYAAAARRNDREEIMQQELADLLIRTITLSCGVESGKDFFKAVLPAIQHTLHSDESLIYFRNWDGDEWREIARYGNNGSFSCQASPGAQTEEVDLRYVPFEFNTDGEEGTTRLFLPLKHESAPSMLLRLSWKNSPPPDWFRDSKVLSTFGESLGSYISWKYMLLEIVSSKRNLESIFDRLPNAVAVIRPDHTLDRVNKAFSEFFRTSYREAVGRKCYEVVRSAISPCPECRMAEVFSGGTEVQMEIGGGADLRVRFLPLGNVDGKMRAMEIFTPLRADKDGPAPQDHAAPFLKLYNLLSQPLSVLTLAAEMLIARGSPDSGYLEVIVREVGRVVRILKDEWKLAQQGDDPQPAPLPDVFDNL